MPSDFANNASLRSGKVTSKNMGREVCANRSSGQLYHLGNHDPFPIEEQRTVYNAKEYFDRKFIHKTRLTTNLVLSSCVCVLNSAQNMPITCWLST